MKNVLSIVAALVLGILIGQTLNPRLSAQQVRRTVKTARLLTTDLGEYCNGKEVTVELNEIGPGTSGRHYHPGHSFTYVLQGSEDYALDEAPSKIVRTGDVLYEPPMKLHTVDNSEPVKLLVVRVIDKGKEATVRR